MFATLRNIIANAIAVKQTTQVNMALGSLSNGSGKDLTVSRIPEHIRTSGSRKQDLSIKGEFAVSDLEDLQSDQLKKAIISLATWSAIAKAFNQFHVQQDLPKNRQNWTPMSNLVEEFHTWNSHAESPIGEEDTLLIIAKLVDVAIPKGNKDTDAIIARVRKVSVEEVQKQRFAKAEAKAKRREESVEAFNTLLWASAQGDDKNFSIPVAKVIMKALQTMEWIASWDAFDPAAQAAELLLIEADVRMLEKMGKHMNDDGKKFIDGVATTDGVMSRYESSPPARTDDAQAVANKRHLRRITKDAA